MTGDGMDLWRRLRGVVCVLVALYLIAPLAIVVIISFSAASFLQFPPPGLSLRWYVNLFDTPAWTDSLVVSVQILIPSATLATLLGTAAAYALVRGRIPGAQIVGAALMLPIIVPGIITAAALFGVYRGLGLNGTLTGLVIGHVVITMPYVVATVSSGLRTMDPRLEDAA
jgi:putative spermidine/putrescine transport system permease protein